MITTKEAVKKATEYLYELYSSTNDYTISNVLLEEIKIDKYKGKDNYYFITLGFNAIKNKPNSIVDSIVMLNGKRIYKSIILDSDGIAKEMKIRELEYA